MGHGRAGGNFVEHSGSTRAAAQGGKKSMASSEPAERYVNRELSWLEFNQRVLDQARDTTNPLLERLKFLCIVSSNLDEFFEVRVGGLKQQSQHVPQLAGPDGLSPAATLEKIADRVRPMVAGQYRCWSEDIRPALAKENIHFHQYPDVPPDERAFFEEHFTREVYPVLTPLAIDAAHPFPQLQNKGLNVVVELQDSSHTDLVVVQVPRVLPRFIRFSKAKDGEHYIFLGDLVRHHAATLVGDSKAASAHLFRITRNSNLYYDEDESHNLLQSIEEELRNANRGAAVRLEVNEDCPGHLVGRLREILALGEADVYRCPAPLNLVRLMPLCFAIDRPDLRDPGFKPRIAVAHSEDSSIFHQIRRGDILLHHPYESFQAVVDLLARAAEDPNVLAIKQTLYRTSSDSPLVHALIQAAHNGKQVTAIIELKARFDEAANIHWARLMQEAGVDVVYGVTGLKTHAKAMLIVRREGDVLRRYAHLGTGNYHPKTATIYTDLGLMTCNEEITADIAEAFNLVTGIPHFKSLRHLLMAPFNMLERFLAMIDREIAHAKEGRPAGIIAKMNALVEKDIIDALYRASGAGVPVRLLVRGICVLRPGVPGLSENIEVRSLVGRFLEHSRVYSFENAGEREIYIGSADWMSRNLRHRVELVCPLLTPAHRDRASELLETFWKDNVRARAMLPDGSYQRLEAGEPPFDAQEIFLQQVDPKYRRATNAS
jgi:polyphosphate kinase